MSADAPINEIAAAEPSVVGAPVPLVEIRRGEVVESIHYGSITAVTCGERLLACAGSADIPVMLRSSAKPLQAVPLVESGAADRFGLDEGELALCCASHCGEEIHVAGVRSILRKIGLSADALRCGAHAPLDADAVRRLHERGEQPGAIHNNCSGKHAGMLATAVHRGEPLENYFAFDHPVQARCRNVIAQFAGVAESDMPHGTDGCNVPTYALPLRRIALAFARLAAAQQASFEQRSTMDIPVRLPGADEATLEMPGNQPERQQHLSDDHSAFFNSLSPARINACSRIVRAMQHRPEMVGGAVQNRDTALMQLAGNRLFSKTGAEGLWAVGIMPGIVAAAGGEAVGIAVKLSDGDARGVRSVPLIEVLAQLGILNREEVKMLGEFHERPVTNCRGVDVGRIVSRLELQHSV